MTPIKNRLEIQDFVEDAASTSKPVMPETDAAPYAPDLNDLYYLYRLVRETAAVSVMEFGSGWSTLVFALGIFENRMSFGTHYSVRHPNPWRLLTIEAERKWLDVTMSRMPPSLVDIVVATATTPRLIEHNGQYASVYDELPPFVPDIIYLDGPDPDQVVGSINGFSSMNMHGLPMSADVLRIEAHLWPNTLVVSDGRIANARFLAANFKRRWQSLHDPFTDHMLMRLDESPFGRISEEHITTRLQASRSALG